MPTAYEFTFTIKVRLESLQHRADEESEFVDVSLYEANRELRRYVSDAVGSWGGQLYPDNLLFSANIKKVEVTGIKSIPPKVITKGGVTYRRSKLFPQSSIGKNKRSGNNTRKR
jgi:hypothetical protein